MNTECIRKLDESSKKLEEATKEGSINTRVSRDNKQKDKKYVENEGTEGRGNSIRRKSTRRRRQNENKSRVKSYRTQRLKESMETSKQMLED